MAKTGRPPTVIDWNLVEELSKIHCTISEIAAVLGIPESTLKNRKEFPTIFKRGKENGKASLRRMQFKAAQNGNTTMLVWLGKNILGQSDQHQESSEKLKKLDINFDEPK